MHVESAAEFYLSKPDDDIGPLEEYRVDPTGEVKLDATLDSENISRGMWLDNPFACQARVARTSRADLARAVRADYRLALPHIPQPTGPFTRWPRV